MRRLVVVLLLVSAVATIRLGSVHAAAPVPLSGTWSGSLSSGPGRGVGGAVSCTLAPSGKGVAGTVVLDAGTVTGSVHVRGRARGLLVWLQGKAGPLRFRWRGRWIDAAGVWRGPAVVRGPSGRAHGMLVLGRGEVPGASCGAADDFARNVMPVVFEPICAQCHVPAGLAAATRLRVTPGDPAATMLSALKLVDLTAPAQSLLLRKPRAEVAHGGGQRLMPGSAEDDALLHWITLMSSPDCQGGSGGGGGGGGGPTGLYADNCASCHGADARGVQGRPDIRCNRNIHDVVRNGRTGGPSGDMPAFPNLADADIATIQAFLVGLCPDATATGADLFAGNCATCHGPTAGGTTGKPAVRCATRIADAVRVGRGAAMPSFPSSALNDAGLTLVETYLDDLCTQVGRPGADLWAGNCASCHGADAHGGRSALGVQGPNVQCSRDIAPAVVSGKGTDMPAFAGLSTADVTSIQQYLLAVCPAATATGADLFASNCASCHGGDARGGATGPAVRCSRSIADAVQNGRGNEMPAFALMTGAEIGRMQTYLDGLCPVGTGTGSELYTSNCAFCHGPTAGGSTDGPSVRCATLVADALSAGRGALMPAFPTLTGVDLTALTAELQAFCAGAGRTPADLYAGNCASCHGATAHGGRNGLGEHGPDIACTSAGDYLDKIRNGEDGMPRFPALSDGDGTAIHDYVHATYCLGG
jgi:mono/diheme cytochrome c family protein